MSDVWMLITQGKLYLSRKRRWSPWDAKPLQLFQPVMPVPIMDGEWNLVNRLVANHYSSPGDREDGDFFEGRTKRYGRHCLSITGSA
ncbi:hypothetical protein O9929_19510 [Vibrio lentus]|nr:hypothetical protein [Vibrio lentus]